MEKKKKGYMTLEEHDAILKAEGRYDAMIKAQQEREAIHQQRVAQFREAESPVVQELRSAGFDVESTWTLVTRSTPYPEALPILLKHLQKPYPADVKESMARAMAVPDAKFAWKTLVKLFEAQNEKCAKDGLAVALAVIGEDEYLEELIELAKNRKHGSSRVLLLSGLKHSKDPRAEAALHELADDPDVCKEVAAILKSKKKPKLWPK